jgi:hypothetical protein
MWSEESFAGRASRAVRKVLQKASSAMVTDVMILSVGIWRVHCLPVDCSVKSGLLVINKLAMTLVGRRDTALNSAATEGGQRAGKRQTRRKVH